MPVTTEMTAVPAVIERKEPSVFLNIEAFENGQRMATVLAKSKLIPKDFQGNLPDCLIALELASRIGASPMAVLQNTYIVHGKPGYSAQFVIAMINSCGRYSPLRFEISGEGDSRSCIAWATEYGSNDRLEGPPCSIAMAKSEGWYQKNGSKWQTMPELMLRYRSATFFGRLYAPELLMGMRTVEELRDTPEAETTTGSTVGDLNERFKPKEEPPAATEKPPAKKKQQTRKPAKKKEPVALKHPAKVNTLIKAVADIQDIETLEIWMNGAEETLSRELEHDDDKAEVRTFVSLHHQKLTVERQKEDEQLEEAKQTFSAPDFLSPITTPDELKNADIDPDIPAPELQLEARQRKDADTLDQWRANSFSRFERTMDEERLGVFLDWLNVLYDTWRAA